MCIKSDRAQNISLINSKAAVYPWRAIMLPLTAVVLLFSLVITHNQYYDKYWL